MARGVKDQKGVAQKATKKGWPRIVNKTWRRVVVELRVNATGDDILYSRVPVADGATKAQVDMRDCLGYCIGTEVVYSIQEEPGQEPVLCPREGLTFVTPVHFHWECELGTPAEMITWHPSDQARILALVAADDNLVKLVAFRVDGETAFSYLPCGEHDLVLPVPPGAVEEGVGSGDRKVAKN